MKKLIFSNLIFLAVLLLLTTPACKKSDDATPTDTQTVQAAAEDNSSSLAESDDAVDATGDLMQNTQVSNRLGKEIPAGGKVTADSVKLNSGIVITITPKSDTTPGQMVIDFGTTGIEFRGRVRKGKITITYTGRYLENGKQQVITFQNYAVAPKGSTQFILFDNATRKTLIHTVSGGIYATQIAVENAKLTYPDNTTLSWSGTRTRTYDTNGTPLNLTDDNFTVSGTYTGVNRKGVSYSVVSDPATPLFYSVGCYATSGVVPVKGKLTITSVGGVASVIDYGDGTCDRKATIAIGSKDPIEFTIK
jgi:hypothetical protein